MGDRKRAYVQGRFLGHQAAWPKIATSFLLMDKNGSRLVASDLGAGRRGVGSSTEGQVAPSLHSEDEGLPQFLIQE